MVGGSFIKLLPQVTEFMKDYRLLVDGVILTAVLLFVPRGIVGLIGSGWERLSRGRSRSKPVASSPQASESAVATKAAGSEP